MAGLAFPKGRPAKLDRDERRRERQATDRAENAKVKARSGGRCEVTEVWPAYAGARWAVRCARRACHIHHMIFGIGVRAHGESAKADRKQHVCDRCHADIHGHVLKRIGGTVPHFTDAYARQV